MNEEEWAACSDPFPMLDHLRRQCHERRLRLFAVACCHDLLRHVTLHPWFSHGLAVAERFADGQATVHELEQCHRYPDPDWCREYAPTFDVNAVTASGQPVRQTKLAINACWNAMEVVEAWVLADVASTNVAWSVIYRGSPETGGSAGRQQLEAYRAAQSDLLRDIFGNPFRPVMFSPAWRTDTAVTLARTMYDARDFSAMPILADALQDAGCDNDDILNHCRDTTAGVGSGEPVGGFLRSRSSRSRLLGGGSGVGQGVAVF